MKLGKDIIDIVIAKLDERSPYNMSADGPLVSGGDILGEVKPVYDLVEEFLPEAADEVCRTIPIRHTVPVDAICDGSMELVCGDRRTYGFIKKPYDYLRLHTLSLPSWVRPVNEVCYEGSNKFREQARIWTRGNSDKPVVTEVPDCIGYYSVKEGECLVPNVFLYIPCFDKENEYTDLTAELIALVVAKKVFEVYGSVENIKIVENEISSVIQNMAL